MDTIEFRLSPKEHASKASFCGHIASCVMAAAIGYAGAVLIEVKSPASSLEVKVAFVFGVVGVAQALASGNHRKGLAVFMPREPPNCILLNRGNKKNYDVSLRRRDRAKRVAPGTGFTGPIPSAGELEITSRHARFWPEHLRSRHLLALEHPAISAIWQGVRPAVSDPQGLTPT
jgi:hypothetical protein